MITIAHTAAKLFAIKTDTPIAVEVTMAAIPAKDTPVASSWAARVNTKIAVD
jgi:hypothetical protein